MPHHARRWAVVLSLATAFVMVTQAGAMASPGRVTSPTPATSEATAPPAASPGTTQVVGKLGVNCAELSASDRAFAVAHGVCPPAGQAHPAATNVQFGNCGWAAVGIADGGGHTAVLEWGFGSSAGIVVYRSLAISYTGGGFPDSGLMFSSTYLVATAVPVTPGFVTISMSGSVTLANFPFSCGIIPLSATDIVA